MFQIHNRGQHIAQRGYRMLIAGLALLLVLSGCGSNTETSGVVDQQTQPLRENSNRAGAVAQAISFAEAATKPDIYSNAFIVLEGKISKVIGPEAFVLADPANPDNVVLVLTNTPNTPATSGYPRDIGTTLEVTGNLHTLDRDLDIDTFARDFGVSLSSEQLADYKGKAVFAAKRISPPSPDLVTSP